MGTQAASGPTELKGVKNSGKFDLANDKSLEETLRYLLIEVEKNQTLKNPPVNK